MAVMPASSQTKTFKVGRGQLTVSGSPQSGGITGPLGDSNISSSKWRLEGAKGLPGKASNTLHPPHHHHPALLIH